VDAGGHVSAPAASIAGDFADAFDFIFHAQESRSGGSDVGGSQLLGLLADHLALSATSIALGVAIAVPLGVWLGHTRRGTFLAVGVANIGRAVPSIALIAFFFAYLGTGFMNVALALTLLAIPPVLANTYVGIRQAEADAVDAAEGMGMTGLQVVRHVELPLAAPLVFGGVRTSAVNVVATATIAPLAGVSSLGDPIIAYGVYGDAGRLGASIVIAALAIATELGFGVIQRFADPMSTTRRSVPS
jgi:osmoprotectant transport system permease protein